MNLTRRGFIKNGLIGLGSALLFPLGRIAKKVIPQTYWPPSIASRAAWVQNAKNWICFQATETGSSNDITDLDMFFFQTGTGLESK